MLKELKEEFKFRKIDLGKFDNSLRNEKIFLVKLKKFLRGVGEELIGIVKNKKIFFVRDEKNQFVHRKDNIIKLGWNFDEKELKNIFEEEYKKWKTKENKSAKTAC